MNKLRIYTCICLILLLSAAGFCLLAFRVHGSIYAKGWETAAPVTPLFYMQKDPDWAGDFLGSSSFSMESSGCLTACLAAASDMQGFTIPGVERMDPGTLNAFLSRRQVYDGEGNIQWEPLEEALHVSIERINGTAALKETDLSSLLSEGIYPIVRVRMKGLGNFHYVLLIQYREGKFWCMDPLHSAAKPVPLSDFGNRIYAVRYLYRT